MSRRPISPVLLGAGGGLVLLCGAAFTIMHKQQQRKKLVARFEATTAPYRAAKAPGAPTRQARRSSTFQALGGRLARFVGLNLDHAIDYPVRWWVVPIVAVLVARAVTGLLGTLAGGWIVALTPIAFFFILRAGYKWCEEERLAKLFKQFPDALAMIVRAVRVGIPVAEAIRAVHKESPEPTAREFGHIADRLAMGTALPEAMRETAERSGVPEYRFFATALALQNQTGGGLSETLENLAEVIRKRVGLKARARALASEAKTSAGILAALPFLTGAVLAVVNFDYVSLLFNDPGGQQVLTVALIMLGVGIMVMRSIIRRSLA